MDCTVVFHAKIFAFSEERRVSAVFYYCHFFWRCLKSNQITCWARRAVSAQDRVCSLRRFVRSSATTRPFACMHAEHALPPDDTLSSISAYLCADGTKSAYLVEVGSGSTRTGVCIYTVKCATDPYTHLEVFRLCVTHLLVCG